MRVSIFAEQLAQDLRYALRRTSRQPGFAFAVIATIAVGVGASAAVFSVVDRILFRPLPFPHEEQLVWLGMTAPIGNDEFLLGGDYFDWREQQRAFSHFSASDGGGECDITEAGNAERIPCVRIAHDYLATFGMAPVLGRAFTPEEDRAGGPKAVLLSHALWRSRYAGSPEILDKTIELNGAAARIAGVLPANFEVPNLARVDVAQPLALDEQAQRGRKGMMRFVRAWARLKPGVTLKQARAAMQPVFEASLRHVPKAFVKEVKLTMSTLRERQARDSRATSLALLAAVLCVLLIACANVVNLFLARANATAREMSIREAIGAGRSRLVRQSLAESTLLCLAGGAAGLALAGLLLRIAARYAPAGMPRMLEATLDARVAAFAVAVTLLAGLASGFRIRSPARSWLRPALVTAQIALAGSLLYGASLLGESLWKMQNVPLGIATERLLTARVDLPAARDGFWNSLEERVGALPGVAAHALSDSLPPAGRAMSMIYSRISIDGKPEDLRGGTGGMVCVRSVSPSYFETFRIPLLRGRTFAAGERDGIILSAALARRLFGSIDALGRKVQPGAGEGWRTVAGVVDDARNNGIEAGDPEYYLPLQRESGLRALHLSVRAGGGGGGEPQLIADLVRAEVRALDPHVPLTFETMERRAGRLTERSRFNAAILSCLALAGLLTGALGVYGVVSFVISQRAKEIAVRMAVGATAGQIRGMIVGVAMRWAAAGAAAGALLMAGLLPLFRHLLFQTPPARPL